MDHVLTLGRQWIYAKPGAVQRVLAKNGVPLSREEMARLFEQEEGYCEPLLRRLGAGVVDSMDVSEYEHATVMQDLNQPWPANLRERFSVVIDAGTLEHVFHFPLALKSCMEAVAVGGHFVAITPANNLLGHGFYQFSPELYFRVFTKENGFSLEKILVYEQPSRGTWYEVSDPERIQSRVELVNSRPTYMIVCAKKVAAADVFAKPPLQSDYEFLYWQQTAGKGTAGELTSKQNPSLKRYIPGWAGNLYRRLRPFRAPYFRKYE